MGSGERSTPPQPSVGMLERCLPRMVFTNKQSENRKLHQRTPKVRNEGGWPIDKTLTYALHNGMMEEGKVAKFKLEERARTLRSEKTKRTVEKLELASEQPMNLDEITDNPTMWMAVIKGKSVSDEEKKFCTATFYMWLEAEAKEYSTPYRMPPEQGLKALYQSITQLCSISELSEVENLVKWKIPVYH